MVETDNYRNNIENDDLVMFPGDITLINTSNNSTYI